MSASRRPDYRLSMIRSRYYNSIPSFITKSTLLT